MRASSENALRSSLIPLFGTGLLLLLAGCHSVSVSHSKPTIPLESVSSPISTASENESQFAIASDHKVANCLIDSPTPITLAQAIHDAVVVNVRVRAGSEKVRQAEAELVSESLIPNPTLLTDSLLNPLPGQRFSPTIQGGPPQADVGVSFPLDWLLFGKRAAAAEAARLGVSVAESEFQDLVRRQIGEVIALYYDALEADVQGNMYQEELDGLLRLERVIAKLVAGGKADAVENGRAQLFIADARRALIRQSLAIQEAKGKLRLLIGRHPLAENLSLQGDLTVSAPLPPPDLDRVLALAEKYRPDIQAKQGQLAKTAADIRREAKRGLPEVGVQPVFTYQYQRAFGFPDARSIGAILTTTLPLSDRNQGNIAKALSNHREAVLTLQADSAQLQSELRRLVSEYRVAYSVVTTDTLAELEASKRLWEQAEADAVAGKGAWKDALEAFAGFCERRRREVAKKADYWRALYAMHSAIGIIQSPPQ